MGIISQRTKFTELSLEQISLIIYFQTKIMSLKEHNNVLGGISLMDLNQEVSMA